MIPVKQKNEPKHFDVTVRQPGVAFLAAHPEGKLKPFWSLALDDLHKKYGYICAYTCCFTIEGEVDHFWPKSKRRGLAYEWANFRLASSSANRTKGVKVGLVDPFHVEEGWFALEFPACDVVLGPNVPEGRGQEVQFTIQALKLNAERLIAGRCRVLVEFRDGEVSLSHLRRFFPFHAAEIVRQGAGAGAYDEGHLRAFVGQFFRNRA